MIATFRDVLKYSENSSRRSVTAKMATAAKPLGFFCSNYRIVKILKVTKHGIAAVDAANMADIKMCGADSAPPRYK